MIYKSALSKQDFNTKALFVSIPHSGEHIPKEADWLKNKNKNILLCDVDRFVDKLYLSSIIENNIPSIYNLCHRYVLDVNRLETDINADSVQDIKNKVTDSGLSSGLYWTKTTKGEPLLSQALTFNLHKYFLDTIYYPFHQEISNYQNKFLKNFSEVYHLDLHSMPSVGTAAHKDKGELRSEIVISDFNQTSCSVTFTNLVKDSFSKYFKVAYNWPYIGGGITKKHGKPNEHCHSIQIEIRRDLYMDEDSKDLLTDYKLIENKLKKCISTIYKSL